MPFMNAYSSSTRARYWRETLQESTRAFPAVWLAGIFVIAILGMVLVGGDFLVSGMILALAIVFGSPFLRAVSRSLGEEGSSRREKPAAPPGASPASPAADTDLERLIQSLDAVEKRLIHLEDIVTNREFDWQRRLAETPAKPPTP